MQSHMDGVHKFRIPFDDLAQRRKLGSGSYGDVWLADYTRVGVQVALKKLKASPASARKQQNGEKAQRESFRTVSGQLHM